MITVPSKILDPPLTTRTITLSFEYCGKKKHTLKCFNCLIILVRNAQFISYWSQNLRREDDEFFEKSQ